MVSISSISLCAKCVDSVLHCFMFSGTGDFFGGFGRFRDFSLIFLAIEVIFDRSRAVFDVRKVIERSFQIYRLDQSVDGSFRSELS